MSQHTASGTIPRSATAAERAQPPRVAETKAEARPRGFSIARHEGPWRDALLRRMLAVADLLSGLAASAALAITANGRVGVALWAAVLSPIWVVVAKLLGLYDRDQRSLRHLTLDELPTIFTWSLGGTASIVLLLALTPAGWVRTEEALSAGLTSAVAAVLFRVIARGAWRRLVPPEKAMIVGQGGLAVAMRRKLELFPDIHVEVVWERPQLLADDLREPMADLDRILIALPSLDEHLIADLVAFCRRHQVKLSVLPPARGLFGTAARLNHVADLPVLEYNTWDVSRSTQLLKRLIDVAVSALGLIVLSPILLAVAVFVLLESGRPVLFAQVRAGQGGRPFTMLKFRTMVANAEELLEELMPIAELREPMFKLRADPRVTRLGAVLRRASLDELPQLVNVLRGQMSLVGPRPEQFDLVQQYEPGHLFRLAVKPGLTGPMQVYGRGELSFEERLAVERDYIENLSVARDLNILGLTVASIFHGRGAY